MPPLLPQRCSYTYQWVACRHTACCMSGQRQTAREFFASFLPAHVIHTARHLTNYMLHKRPQRSWTCQVFFLQIISGVHTSIAYALLPMSAPLITAAHLQGMPLDYLLCKCLGWRAWPSHQHVPASSTTCRKHVQAAITANMLPVHPPLFWQHLSSHVCRPESCHHTSAALQGFTPCGMC